MKEFTREKPYECKQCGKCFSQAESLRNHEIVHTGEKPYECKQCGKCFSRAGSLRTHERVHTGEKPYECKQCGKCFSRSDDLRRHGRKTYECKQRGKCFNLSRDPRVHQKVHSTNMSHKRDSSKRLCKQTGSNTRSNRSRVTNKSISQRKTRDKCKEGVQSAIIEKQSCWICQEEISSQALLLRHYENHMRHVAEEDS